MDKAISNTLPILYLYRIGVLNWLPQIFEEVYIPQVVVQEIEMGAQLSHDVPHLDNYPWLKVGEPIGIPEAWNVLNLGEGELSVMALALQRLDYIVLLDDLLARRMAQTAGLTVWGTLRVLLEAKNCGLTESIAPAIDNLAMSGVWIPEDVRRRILDLAGE